MQLSKAERQVLAKKIKNKALEKLDNEKNDFKESDTVNHESERDLKLIRQLSKAVQTQNNFSEDDETLLEEIKEAYVSYAMPKQREIKSIQEIEDEIVLIQKECIDYKEVETKVNPFEDVE